jgi:hypothetical protein
MSLATSAAVGAEPRCDSKTSRMIAESVNSGYVDQRVSKPRIPNSSTIAVAKHSESTEAVSVSVPSTSKTARRTLSAPPGLGFSSPRTGAT